MEITPKLSHHNKKFGLMFIFKLLKCEICHNAIIIIPLINISKNVSIHESMFKSFVLFFFFASLCKYSLDILYVTYKNALCYLYIQYHYFLECLQMEQINVSRGGSRAAAASKMERFVIMVNGFQLLTFITKPSNLDVAVTLDPPLVTAQSSKVQRYFASISENWPQTITFNQLIRFCHEDSIYNHREFV